MGGINFYISDHTGWFPEYLPVFVSDYGSCSYDELRGPGEEEGQGSEDVQTEIV